MSQNPKKNTLFSKIENATDAAKTIKDAAIGFLCVAGLQAILGVFLTPALIGDAIILAILAAILMKWRSRTAAVLLLAVTGLEAGVTLLNRFGVMTQGGKNVFLAVIMVIAAVRAVEATFKWHGKYGGRLVQPPAPRPSQRLTPPSGAMSR
jgi:uncharacterized membrane protein